MIEGKLWLALKGRLDQWPECLVARPEEGFAPNSEQPYIIAQFVPLSQERRGLQWACGDELRGILNLSVCVPLSWDFAAHLGLANRIGALFPAGARYNYGGETAEIYERARVATAPRIDGGHNRIEVQIGWRSLYVPKTGQVISILSGSGYAGSVYSSTIAGQWYADDVAIIGETGSTWTMTLAYEGAAIRCAESNVIQMWVPTSSLFSAVFDIRRNITLAGSNVTAWGSSVNGVVATQDASAYQPLYIESPPSIEFTEDFLLTQSDFPGSGSDISVIGLAQWVPDGGTILAGSTSGTYIMSRRTAAEGGNLAAGLDGTGFLVTSSVSVDADSPAMFATAVKGGESYAFRVNGADGGSGSTTFSPNVTGTFRIGRMRTASRPFNGNISSLLVSRQYLSTENMTKTEGWIAHTLNVASLLPPDHPYKTASPRIQ